MRATRSQLEAVLNAAERLLAAREAQMVTTEEWDTIGHAVAACREPAASERSETFAVDDARDLVRSVVPARGEPYQHRCPGDAFEAVAHAIADAEGRFNLEDLQRAAKIPWTQAAVAFAFLKERCVVVPAGGRNHAAASGVPFEDAMIEYHALREKGSEA
ncbi:MAG: hypothetical protein JNK58_12160 [Phycisphaerae bacterium]|nr:hypothetical protein [Phycisphaerae bacterium]